MLRVVLDTSSLVSYVLTRGDIMRRVIAHWRANRYVLLSSPQTRAELAAVLARPQIRRLATAPPVGLECDQQSSYDRASVAPDKDGWFANGDTLFWSLLQAGLAWCM